MAGLPLPTGIGVVFPREAAEDMLGHVAELCRGLFGFRSRDDRLGLWRDACQQILFHGVGFGIDLAEERGIALERE